MILHCHLYLPGFLKEVSSKVSSARSIYVTLVIVLVIIYWPEVGYAANDASIEKTLCMVVKTLTGTVGRSLAAIAIIFLGFSLFLGKISWGIALSLAIGVGAVFGAPQLVSTLAGNSDQNCETILGNTGHDVSPAGGGMDGINAAPPPVLREVISPPVTPTGSKAGTGTNIGDVLNTDNLASPPLSSPPSYLNGQVPSGTYAPTTTLQMYDTPAPDVTPPPPPETKHYEFLPD